MMKPKPTRCVDPVMKYCQGCQYGWVEYPSWVEIAADLDGCSFESGCMYGFDQGRPEDEPTEEELQLMAHKCSDAYGGKKGSAKVLLEADMLAIYRMAAK